MTTIKVENIRAVSPLLSLLFYGQEYWFKTYPHIFTFLLLAMRKQLKARRGGSRLGCVGNLRAV